MVLKKKNVPETLCSRQKNIWTFKRGGFFPMQQTLGRDSFHHQSNLTVADILLTLLPGCCSRKDEREVIFTQWTANFFSLSLFFLAPGTVTTYRAYPRQLPALFFPPSRKEWFQICKNVFPFLPSLFLSFFLF